MIRKILFNLGRTTRRLARRSVQAKLFMLFRLKLHEQKNKSNLFVLSSHAIEFRLVHYLLRHYSNICHALVRCKWKKYDFAEDGGGNDDGYNIVKLALSQFLQRSQFIYRCLWIVRLFAPSQANTFYYLLSS